MEEIPGKEGLAAWRTFLTAHAVLIRRIDRELIEQELLPLDWYDVLLALEEAPDQRLRLHELAEAVLLSRSGLTRLVDRLEAAGLIRRAPCPADRRGFFAVLTDRGLAARERTWPAYAQAIVAHFTRHLNAAEADMLTKALVRVLSAP